MTVETILKYGTRILIIFMVLPVHEFAHAFAAKKLGDRTAENSGRLTLNPISHIDPIGAICLLLAGFGWAKPVPIYPNRCKHIKAGTIITALAGPLANIIVAYIALVIYKIVIYVAGGITTQAMVYVTFIISYFVMINLMLAVFNLIPIPPLDGSRVLTVFLPLKYQWKIQQYQMYISIGFMVLILFGVLNRPLNWLSGILYTCIEFLSRWVDFIF